MIDTKLLAQ